MFSLYEKASGVNPKGLFIHFTAGMLMALGLAACSDSKDVAGGVTDIGNSVAQGIVVTEADKPVAHARVVAYYDNWDKTSIEDSVETSADENGHFSLSIDSMRHVVLFAIGGDQSGISRVQKDAHVVVGNPRRLESSIAARSSGYMRIVGSFETAPVNEDGSFAFESMPVGEISLVYVAGGQPQARFNFVTENAADTIRIPALEELEQNGDWLTVSDYRYYVGAAFGGIVVTAPDYVTVPKAFPQDTISGDTTETDTTTRDTLSLDTSATDSTEDLQIDITLHLDSGVVLIEKDSIPVTEVDYVDGISGKAVQLKQGQFIELGTLDPCAGDFTLSLWTKWKGPNGNHQVLFCQRAYWSDSTSRFQWHFESNSGQFVVMKSLPKFPYAVVFCDSSKVPQNEWAHLALVSRDRVLTMYVNGEAVEILRGDSDYTGIPLGGFIPNDLLTPVPFRIGGDEIDVETWNGAIDEIKIASTARSAEWVRAEYEKFAK